jgi:predicted small secreted protein
MINVGRTTMARKLVLLVTVAALVVGAGGCNTIEGLGKDVKAAGGGIEKAAEKTKPY